MAGTWLAIALFVAVIVAGVTIGVITFRNHDTTSAEAAEPSVDGAPPVAEATDAPSPAKVDEKPTVVDPPQPPPPPDDRPRSLDEITWTVATPSTIDQLVQAWSIPRESLIAMNPKLPTADMLAPGTRVVVHTGPIDDSESVGPPNDGRLVNGVPFPEGRAWLLAPDRSRAFGTGELLVNVLAALDAYAETNKGAPPIQLGEISARKGGPIYGHQSHQAGRDIDIRLVIEASGERFDAALNWSLVKTLIDGGEVVAIFLNRTQQVWLRAAAEADVGVDGADRYFALIKHEPGHIIHIHVRFRCPDSDHRCVAYSLDETDAEVAKKLSKLPSKGGGGGGLIKKKGQLPTLKPKTGPRKPSKNLPRK